jgi:hypothetical protein
MTKKKKHDPNEEEVTVTIGGEKVEVEEEVKDLIKKSEDYA